MVLADRNVNAYQLARYALVHAKAIEYLGGRCANCGSTEKLEIDHIDRSTKSFDISSRTCYAWQRILDELRKCQALCHDCHKAKSDRENEVEHGQGKTGKRHCRCDLCAPLKRAAGREYARKCRAKKREASGRTGAAL